MHDTEYALKVHQWSASDQWYQESAELLFRCKLRSMSMVLDVGTNMGRMMQLVLTKGGIPIGVETNTSARNLAAQSGIKIYEDLREAARRHGPFDIVLLSHVLGHCEDPEQTLNSCLSIVKRDGCVGVLVPNPTYDWLMTPMNVVTGYKSDQTLKHSIGLRSIKRMLPWWFTAEDVFYLGEKPKWLPDYVLPEQTRSRLGVIIRRRKMDS